MLLARCSLLREARDAAIDEVIGEREPWTHVLSSFARDPPPCEFSSASARWRVAVPSPSGSPCSPCLLLGVVVVACMNRHELGRGSQSATPTIASFVTPALFLPCGRFLLAYLCLLLRKPTEAERALLVGTSILQKGPKECRDEILADPCPIPNGAVGLRLLGELLRLPPSISRGKPGGRAGRMSFRP